jgi:hypothetical protein
MRFDPCGNWHEGIVGSYGMQFGGRYVDITDSRLYVLGDLGDQQRKR